MENRGRFLNMSYFFNPFLNEHNKASSYVRGFLFSFGLLADISWILSWFQILSDKDRLIKRTQLKRSAYRVLGKSEDEQKQNMEYSEVCTENLSTAVGFELQNGREYMCTVFSRLNVPGV